ncbi:DUF4153 domain-containing protein [Caulobacter endophyticus]|uniref:DUF4153 domain-containing protein n=1 Tax=Caulobacter endophyticus TaxID=2172652 RepID=UPI002410643A|nr:DUF4153 domain-containing protein [Caulobacter endophyticus]MDG2528325.1 DUF4153 domain-containing protein [Caulobacter endophyticus]
MTDTATEIVANPKAARRAGLIRLATGLVQGVLLYALYEASERKVWPSNTPMLFAALALAAMYAPFVVLAGASSLRPRTLIGWTAAAVLLAAGLTAYDIWTVPHFMGGRDVVRNLPDGSVFCAVAALLFIGHHLVQPADMERRPIARFATYFDVTWKHGVQLALSLLFTGAFWLLLFLAGQLFKLIGIDAIERLIREEAFSFPATTVMFAAAVQLTDVRANLVRGVRTVSLTLLAWLLPLMVLIAGGFLLSLPFTGLAPLWATRKAAALLLTAAAFLIVLTNAAYQDGAERPSPVLAWAARIAGLLLAPITALAAYAVWLRVAQYGLTPERVYGLACIVVAVGYAVGYAIAAVRPGAWMKPLETTNIAMAFATVGVLLALFTSLADPRRVSVSDQVSRLERGAVKAETFDFDFLRFGSARFGREALDRLKTSADPKIAELAKASATRSEPLPRGDRPVDTPPDIVFHPAGTPAPDGFLTRVEPRRRYDTCFGGDGQKCDARLLDVTGDGRPEVLLSSAWSIEVYAQDADGGWRRLGQFTQSCGSFDAREAIREGRLSTAAPAVSDLVGPRGAMRFEWQDQGCPPQVKPPQKP